MDLGDVQEPDLGVRIWAVIPRHPFYHNWNPYILERTRRASVLYTYFSTPGNY